MKNLARTLIGIVIFLIILGTIIIFSARGYSFFISHISKVIFASAAFVLFAVIPYKYYKEISKYMLMGIILALIYTLFSPAVKGASRWMNLGFMSFQPSEFAKIFLLIHLAVLIEKKGEMIKDFNNGLLYMLLWIGVVSLLIFIQPNVSTTIIVVSTSFILLFVGGARISHLSGIIGSVGAIGALGAMALPHSRARILGFVKSITEGGSINLQVLQSKIALGSGGFFGLGIGQSRQSDLFLPEPHNDFVFSVEIGRAHV